MPQAGGGGFTQPAVRHMRGRENLARREAHVPRRYSTPKTLIEHQLGLATDRVSPIPESEGRHRIRLRTDARATFLEPKVRPPNAATLHDRAAHSVQTVASTTPRELTVPVIRDRAGALGVWLNETRRQNREVGRKVKAQTGHYSAQEKPHSQVPSHRVATSNQPINRTSLHKKRSERLCHASVERAVDPNPVARPPRSADHSESMDAPSFTARQSGNKGRGVHDSSWTGGNSLILKAVCRVDAVCFRSAVMPNISLLLIEASAAESLLNLDHADLQNFAACDAFDLPLA